MIAIAGWEPWPHCTIRELVVAAEAKQRNEWNHTAGVLSMMANLHAKGRYTPYQFHPMHKTRKLHLDDPAATYRWLKQQEQSHERRNNLDANRPVL